MGIGIPKTLRTQYISGLAACQVHHRRGSHSAALSEGWCNGCRLFKLWTAGQDCDVHGASQGIGRAIAVGLAQAGAHVVLAKHPEGRHDEIKGTGRDRSPWSEGAYRDRRCGERGPGSIDGRSGKEMFGRIDILVNNAGWTGTGPALDVTEEAYDKTMDASVKSWFFACQAAAKVMIPQGGKIINIGSNSASSPSMGGGVRRSEGRSASLSRAMRSNGQVGRARERRGAVHHRTESRKVSRAARLQRMGDDNMCPRAAGTSRKISWVRCYFFRAISPTWWLAMC